MTTLVPFAERQNITMIMRNALSWLVALALSLPGCALPGAARRTAPLKYGMQEIFEMAESYDYDVSEAIRLTGALGAKSFRLNLPIRNGLMLSPTEMAPALKEKYTKWIAELYAAGVTQVIIQNEEWLLADNSCSATLVPEIDGSESSDYAEFMARMEAMWYTMALNFPQVSHWQPGNEISHVLKMYENRPREEGIRITVDIMYYANRGIKRANPGAVTIMPALAPVNGIAAIAEELEAIYEIIESGESLSGSADKRDYFDALAWHPYVDGGGRPDCKWVKANNTVYDVAKAHGDDGIKVFLTEFGWPDNGEAKRDRKQAIWFWYAYHLVKTKMPYVEAMHVYCLLEYSDWSDEVNFPGISFTYGIFKPVNRQYVPKRQAYAIRFIFGGTGDIRPRAWA